jgi:hypothetical protein
MMEAIAAPEAINQLHKRWLRGDGVECWADVCCHCHCRFHGRFVLPLPLPLSWPLCAATAAAASCVYGF